MSRPSRAKLALVALGVVIAALAASSALAYFTSTGAGSPAASVSSLGKPTISVATGVDGGTVNLTWGAVTAPDLGAVSYYVTRDGEPAAGTCPTAASPGTAVTCVDKEVEPGTHEYVVTAVWGPWTTTGPGKTATVKVGPATHFKIAAASLEPLAGAADNLTITALDVNNEKVTAYAGEKSLTFSGASLSPNATAPTVSNKTGTATKFGSVTTIGFTAGVATASGSNNGVMRLYKSGSTSITVSDGTVSASPALSVTVATATAVPSKFVLAVESATPVAGAADDLTISAQDAYGNVTTGYTGAKSLTFSGAVASAAGNPPTVTNASGEAIAFGAATSIEFEGGAAATSGPLNGEMRLYKSATEAKVVVSNGTATSAAVKVVPTAAEAVRLGLTASPLTPVAGATVTLTTTAQDVYGNTATGYSGSKNLVYSGAVASPAGTVPTVTNTAGTAIAFGAPALTTFTSGSSGSKTMKLYKAGPTSVSVTDGTLSSETPVNLTVSTNATLKIVVTPETTTPVVGAADDLTISEQDTYGNLITTYSGTKSLTFSGPLASGGGNLPTVTNASGEPIAVGTATPIEFEGGVAATSGSLNGEMRLYRNASATLKVTDGTLTSAGIAVIPTTTAINFLFASSASTLAAGGSSNLTLTARDAYANTVTTYAGAKNIVFSGAGTSPAGTVPTVSNSSGSAINLGSETALTFTAGVSTVSTTKNGVFKAYKAETLSLSATDGTISSANSPSITVTPTTVTRFAFDEPVVSAGTLTSFCAFTCTATGLGSSGTIKGGVSATDAYGNVVSNLGTGHTVGVTVTGTPTGTVTGGSLPLPSTGPAESATQFTYTAPTSGTYSNVVKAAATVGTAYTAASITANK